VNINDLGKLLGKPPIKAPKPIKATINMDACARILAATEDVSKADRPVRKIRTCPCCRQPHPSDTPCKPLERSDNGYTLERP